MDDALLADILLTVVRVLFQSLRVNKNYLYTTKTN